MGMRSDLAKELKSLLDSDIIKGKVTVQRAYADWRRYPQYIVPLSEASIDLIFAPAYGSSKKNATDIRMAIDGMEIVFIRPEIGTFILLTGDSDFSSLVLKLKEYGKYVIGIGIQESSSDILVQNCDEYYSYTSISGLRKTTDTDQAALDPWVAVEQSLKRMVSRGDVMRSDRLKQVMLEIDPGFDEKSYGFSKFSRFLAEASAKGLISLKKLENGQYEVGPPKGDRKSDRGRRSEARRGRRDKAPRKDRKGDRTAAEAGDAADVAEGDAGGDPLANAYAILREALSGFPGGGHEGIRDSDVKRKILAMDRGFDETELGFAKFSRFLKQAHEHGVIVLNRRDSGNYEVTLGDGAIGVEAAEVVAPEADAEPRRGRGRRKKSDDGAAPSKEEASKSEATEAEAEADAPEATREPRSKSRGRAVGARRGSQGKRRGEAAPSAARGPGGQVWWRREEGPERREESPERRVEVFVRACRHGSAHRAGRHRAVPHRAVQGSGSENRREPGGGVRPGLVHGVQGPAGAGRAGGTPPSGAGPRSLERRHRVPDRERRPRGCGREQAVVVRFRTSDP